MRISKIFFFILLQLFSILCAAQSKKYLYYFDRFLGAVGKDDAVFNGVGTYEDGLFSLMVFNNETKALIFSEHFADSTLRVSEGLFESHFANASLEMHGNYHDGKENGLWIMWDSVGNMTDSIIFDDGTRIKETKMGYRRNTTLDSIVINDLEKHHLYKTYYDDSERIVKEVFFTGDKGLLRLYENGKLISSDSVFTRNQLGAYFPGGDKAWQLYLDMAIRNNGIVKREFSGGSCDVEFIIGSNGKVRDVHATSMIGSTVAELSEYIVKNSPKWKPAMQYGRPLDERRRQVVFIHVIN